MAEQVFDQALEQIADRQPIDWDALEREIDSVDDRRWMNCVRVLEDIARFHFSSDDDEPALLRGDGEATTSGAVTVVPAVAEQSSWWGRYRLDKKVGEGAFGCVYCAWDPELEREVAVKVLHKRVAEARLKDRLLREGRALARVRHPNVVSVLSVETNSDQIALCMEFVHGETLEDGLERGPLSAREATLVCQDVCRALAAVHLAGFVHQDVKARNVMREKAGRIVLMDFGAGQDVSQLAVFGKARVAGTPLYMAPEVLAGQTPSPTSDVYSVGVLLYHLVTARYPLEGHTLDEIRAAHMQGRRQLLGERRPELPVPFLQVVDKALAADPARRYATAAQFLEALVGIADDIKPAPVPQMSLLARVLWTSAAVLSAAFGLGFMVSMQFNQALGRSDFVSETPRDWLIWGFRSWIGTIITLLMIGLGTAALLIIRQMFLTMPRVRDVEGRMVDGAKRRLRRFGLHDPVSGIVSAGVLLAAVTLVGGFWYFGPFLSVILQDLSRAPAEMVAMLSPANRPYHELYRKTFTGIMILSGAVWYATWRLARSRRDIVHIAIFVSAGAVVVLSTIYLTLPFRLIYQNRFEVVRWQGQECYAIGERQQDVLLFCPALREPRNRVVRKNSEGLEYTGRNENVFTQSQ